MLGNKHRQNDNELIILKLKTADAEKRPVPVHFEISKKVDGKWGAVGDTKDVSGDITKIELYTREWEGVETPLVKIFIEDAEAKETYLLDLRYNMLSRNLFNTLLSLTSFEGVSIGVYERKKEEKTFPAVSVKQDGKLVNWKYKIDELPKVETVRVGKKDITNFDNLNDFFIEELKKLSELVKGAPAPVAKKPAAPAPEPEEGEEIPF